MATDRDRVLLLAEAISDGRTIDWTTAEGGLADPAERELVRQLRLLAGMAGVHRPGGLDAGLQVPRTWGELEIIERVGFGALGSVYRAREPRRRRTVALKLLERASTEAQRTAFIEQGRLMSTIRSPHCVSVFGAGESDGKAGVWMEFVDGRTLDRIVRSTGPLSPREAASIGIELCDALQALHARNVTHGAVRPGNVMREVGGRIVLMEPDEPGTVAGDLCDLADLLGWLTAPGDDSRAPAIEDSAERRRLGEVIDRAHAPLPARHYASATMMRAALADVVVHDEGRATARAWRVRIAALVLILAALAAAAAFL